MDRIIRLSNEILENNKAFRSVCKGALLILNSAISEMKSRIGISYNMDLSLEKPSTTLANACRFLYDVLQKGLKDEGGERVRQRIDLS